MMDEFCRRSIAADTAGRIKNELITIYERNGIPGLNGFQLTYQNLSDDLDGLSDEIYEMMKHPRKYKAMLMMFAYIRNM